ncbi:MAG: DUF4396 domain-containing protein [Chlamydiota bacterium]|jgi:hypothetical protein
MLDGIIYLWFFLTALSAIYISYDLIKNTPSAKVMKLAWFLVVLYTGPIGLFLYLLSCKEPLPETHEEFIKPLWKQALGSEVHCLAGDATGIIAAAFILSFMKISIPWEITLEYLAGFGFGLFIFQALFMKSSMGGSYFQALKTSFYPEWLSMNMIMAGMIPVMVIWKNLDSASTSPTSLHFWAMMSLASLVGGILAYPMNYWLVKKGLKHGMMTVRREKPAHEMHHMKSHVSRKSLFPMMWYSIITLFIGSLLAYIFH